MILFQTSFEVFNSTYNKKDVINLFYYKKDERWSWWYYTSNLISEDLDYNHQFILLMNKGNNVAKNQFSLDENDLYEIITRIVKKYNKLNKFA